MGEYSIIGRFESHGKKMVVVYNGNAACVMEEGEAAWLSRMEKVEDIAVVA